MGTPEWAISSLQEILNSGLEISAVFTQPDRPVGRKRELTTSSIKQFAQNQKLPVHTPEKAGNLETLELVRSLAPELIIVCAYGQILPHSFLEIPRIDCFNLHFSFLPKLRGASPVQAAITSGLETTGVSLQKIVLKLDAGPLVATSYPESISPDDTTPLLGSRLAEIGGQLIRKTLPKLLEDNFTTSEQNEEEATYCRIIKKDEGRVRWTEETAREIERKLRAFTPWPGIFTFFSMSGKNENKRRIQLTKVEVVNESFEPGKIFPALTVGTRTGGLRILRLKPEGKQEMDADSFLRGNPQIVGTVLE